MIVLPIVDRELRVAARRAATYRTRLWAALAAMALVGWKCMGFAWQGAASSASQGRSLFYTLSTLAFIYCLGIGARVTSDCVSEEKREGTLGLLFLTDLRSMDVVLGKLVASSLNSLYGLLAVLPMLAMPLLLGGITLGEFGRMVLVLLNALFFSLSVGMFVSSISRNERKAMMSTILGVLAPAAIPFSVLFFLVFVLEIAQDPSELAALVPWLTVNPIYPFVLLWPAPFFRFLPIPEWSFWASLIMVQVLSWALLLITARILPVVWKDRSRAPVLVRRIDLVERWRIWTQGDAAQRLALRERLLERNPFLWLVSRDRLKPAYAWLFLLCMIAVWLWGYWQHRDVMFDFYPLVPTILLIHSFLKVWIVSEVSHRLVEDQRNGALELLLSTPLTMEDILRGQRLALLRQFARPVLVLCAIELVAFQTVQPLAFILPVLLMLVADLFTLMWVAMRLSLTARSINEVLFKSLFWVLVLPWIAFIVASPLIQATWRHLAWAGWEPGPGYQVYLWFTIGIVNDLILVLAWARPHLLARLRQPKFGPLQGVWQRWEARTNWKLTTYL